MAVRLMPSVSKLVIAWLRASADMQSLVGDRIGQQLYAGSGAAVMVTHVTGSEPVRRHLIAEVIDIKAYGGTPDDAELIAFTADAVLHDIIGVRSGGTVDDDRNSGVITAVETMSRPAPAYDDVFEPARPRFIGSYVVTLHPNPS